MSFAKILLWIYTLFFPQCEIVVIAVIDPARCYVDSAPCYAAVASTPDAPLRSFRTREAAERLLFSLPFVTLASCWSAP